MIMDRVYFILLLFNYNNDILYEVGFYIIVDIFELFYWFQIYNKNKKTILDYLKNQN